MEAIRKLKCRMREFTWEHQSVKSSRVSLTAGEPWSLNSETYLRNTRDVEDSISDTRTPTYRYPYQRIAFHAIQFSPQTITQNQVVHFDYEHINYRSSFDVTKGVFIAPLRGVYIFSVSLACPANSQCQGQIVKNDVGLGVIQADSIGSPSDIDQGSSAAVLSLDEGDRVWVQGTLPRQTIAGDRDTMFSGALVWELS